MTNMQAISLKNPFSAPVFYRETTVSAMLDIKDLAAQGTPHGSVAATDFQEAGRGRGANRSWQAERGQNLLFALLLRYPGAASLPQAITLRTALALCRAIERIAPALKDSLRVKWPNDVMLPLDGSYRKTAGILAEWDGQCLFLGVGVNVGQTQFPEAIRNKAGSIALALGRDVPRDARCALLEAFLERLRADLEGPATTASAWREQLEERLYMKGERARFLSGAADSGEIVEGLLCGLGEGGELLIQTEKGIAAFAAGELEVY
ncbi:MAG: biotin--[acetyl-CoA-carboxylase] ligase [Treponema sp.]|jgi:BirA family biotin operon repressor/biotin-[acetyl-CoA-carboxylase] ligase|nr:biotin--[acetyl-CoA-carboxylase] ligase [Treponema sp.]